MKIKQLIFELNEYFEIHGNCEVCITYLDDYECGRLAEIEEVTSLDTINGFSSVALDIELPKAILKKHK